MNLIKKLFLLLLLSGFLVPVHAAVDGVELNACSIFSDDGGKKDGDTKEEEEEEEPDCE